MLVLIVGLCFIIILVALMTIVVKGKLDEMIEQEQTSEE
jgi:hypothetical protein